MNTLIVMLSLFISLFQVTATASTNNESNNMSIAKSEIDTNITAREDTISGLNYLALWTRKSIETKRLDILIKIYKVKNYSRFKDMIFKALNDNDIFIKEEEFKKMELTIIPICNLSIDTFKLNSNNSIYNFISLDTNINDFEAYVLIEDSKHTNFPYVALVNKDNKLNSVSIYPFYIHYPNYILYKTCTNFILKNLPDIMEKRKPDLIFYDWLFIFNERIYSNISLQNSYHYCDFDDFFNDKTKCMQNFELDRLMTYRVSIDQLKLLFHK